MFLTLLLVTLAVALSPAGLVAWMFDPPLAYVVLRGLELKHSGNRPSLTLVEGSP